MRAAARQAHGRDAGLRAAAGHARVAYTGAAKRIALPRPQPPSQAKERVMKILVVLTSHDRLGDTGRKTGFWLEELAAPYYAFKDAGAEIVLASPKGGQPPDRKSVV